MSQPIQPPKLHDMNMNSLHHRSTCQSAALARFIATRVKPAHFARNGVRLLIAVTLVAFAGCGRKPAAGPPEKSPSATETASAQPALELWTAGEATRATDVFLRADFRQGPLFAAHSPLRLSEAALAAVPASERQSKIEQVIKQTGELKKLAAHIAKLGQEAAEKNDVATARRHFEQLRQFGSALEQANPPKITQLTAQAIRKQAEPALARLPQ
jgi:predicted small lipoprotein YifL